MFSCTEEVKTDLDNKILIESFINIGRLDNKIEIRLFSPLSKSGSAPLITPQSTQIVNLTKGISLFPKFESTGIFLLNSESLDLGEGDNLELRINYEGNRIFASTKVPETIKNIKLDGEKLKINYILDGIPNRISLSWDKENDPDYFLVQIDTASKDPDIIEEDRINSDPSNPYLDRVGIPITDSEIEITYPSVEYFGRHKIILYHISRDFYELYINPVQGSYNKLNQSVINGLGIFTAMNSDTIYFNVIP